MIIQYSVHKQIVAATSLMDMLAAGINLAKLVNNDKVN